MPRNPHRFSIRLPHWGWFLMFAIVLAIAGIGLRFGLPVYHHQKAIQQIERMNGKVSKVPGGPSWLRRWIGDNRMEVFAEVEAVSIFADGKSDPQLLAYIGWLTETRKLSLSGSAIEDDGFKHLTALTQLQSLELAATQITEAGLTPLARMQRLERLSL